MGCWLAADLGSAKWLPAPVQRAWRYASALEIVPWDVGALTNFVERIMGCSLASGPTFIMLVSASIASQYRRVFA